MKGRIKIYDLPEPYKTQAMRQLQTTATVPVANMESIARREPVEKKKNKRLDSRGGYVLHIHSRRTRLVDADGVSAKACIDGLVCGGIFKDDSPDIIKEVRTTQAKSKEEETFITAYEVENPNKENTRKDG